MLRGLRLVVPALLLTASACAHSSGGEAAPADGSAKVEVRVTNQNALPMEIHASGSGIRHRLGTVHSGMEAHFLLPRNLVGSGSVEFEARPSGGGQPFRSGELLVSPGSFVDMMIASQLFNSTVDLR